MRQGATGPGYLDRIWHVSSPLSRRPMIPCAGQALGCPVKGVHQRTLHAGESRRGFIRLHIHSKLTMTTSSGRCSNATHVTSQDGFRDANKFVARVFRGTKRVHTRASNEYNRFSLRVSLWLPFTSVVTCVLNRRACVLYLALDRHPFELHIVLTIHAGATAPCAAAVKSLVHSHRSSQSCNL